MIPTNEYFSSSICRTLDPLGRIVIPREWRKVLRWARGDKIEISKENDCIILRKSDSSEIEMLRNFIESTEKLISEEKKVEFGELVQKLYEGKADD